MKVALCLSGQLRTFKECFPSIQKSILEPWTPDVFFSTEIESLDSLNKAQELYKPKAWEAWSKETILSKFDVELLESRKVEGTHVPNFICGRKRIEKAHLLAKEHGTYDLFIRCRFDLQMYQPLVYDGLEGITIPEGYDYRQGIQDQLAWGDQKSMDVYCDLINRVEDYAREGFEIHPEGVLRMHLERYAVQINRTNFPFGIQR